MSEQHFSYESAGPGGMLHWVERRDGHWRADGPRGHFDLVKMNRNFHLWWKGKDGSYMSLGRHATLGGAFARARQFLDEEVSQAAEARKSGPTASPEDYGALIDHLKNEGHSNDYVRMYVGSDALKQWETERSGVQQEAKVAAGAAEESIVQTASVIPEPAHLELPVEVYRAWVEFGERVGTLDDSGKIYGTFAPMLLKYDQEIFIVIVTDLHHRLRGVYEVARGERSRVAVGLEEVLRPALMTPGGHHFLVAHQHPTGDSQASPADVKLFHDIEKAAKPFSNLIFLDHVVIGVGEYYSIREGVKHEVAK